MAVRAGACEGSLLTSVLYGSEVGGRIWGANCAGHETLCRLAGGKTGTRARQAVTELTPGWVPRRFPVGSIEVLPDCELHGTL